MRIAVIGLGHIGLVTALGLAEFGNNVVGYDLNPQLRNQLKYGTVPYAEPGLQEALARHLNTLFMVADSIEIAAKECSCFLFCVGTPSDNTGKADLSILETAVEQVLSCLPSQSICTLIVRSPVYPGGIREKIMPITEKYKERGMTRLCYSKPSSSPIGTGWTQNPPLCWSRWPAATARRSSSSRAAKPSTQNP